MRSFEIPEQFLNQIARSKRVSEGELEALKLALKNYKSKDIAKQLNISETAVRKRLGEVYKKFEITGKGPGKLATLAEKLGKTLFNDPDAGSDWVFGSQAAISDAQVPKTMLSEPRAADTANDGMLVQSGAIAQPSQTSAKTSYDWGDAPTLSTFHGRQEPLESLAKWIAQRTTSPKLLAICGIGGIGKSYLARRLAGDVGDDFQRVVWLSMDETKPPDVLLRSLQSKLQSEHQSELQSSSESLLPSVPSHSSKWGEPDQPLLDQEVGYREGRSQTESSTLLIGKIVALMVQQSALVVLDGFDSIFQGYSALEGVSVDVSVNTDDSPLTPITSTPITSTPGTQDRRDPTFHVTRQQQSSLYKSGFEIYGELLKALKKCRNSKALDRASCLIMTSRERPRELTAITDEDVSQKLFNLEGLNPDSAEKMLKEFRLKGSSKDYQAFIDRYCGHPMALKLSANTVKDVFYGRIRDFLAQEISVFDDLRSLLKTQFNRLPPTEKEVMYWLAINHQPCTLEDLRADIVAEDHKRNILYTLRSLQRRSLIRVEQKEKVSSFQLHPIVSSYVLDRFIRAIFLDLIRHDLSLFNDHALMKADAEDEVREFQLKNIVQPILERLRNHCKSLDQVDRYLSDRLDKFRENNPHRLGYAGGNFVNLLVQLSQGQRLADKDFSQLTIWQAYLQSVQIREVNFNRCVLDRSVFTETLSDVMAIAFSPTRFLSESSGTPSGLPKPLLAPLLAAGDANGIVHLWPTRASKASRQQCSPKWAEWTAHSSWIRAIAFVPNQSLLVTGGDDNWLKLWHLPMNNLQGLIQPSQVWQKPACDWVHAIAVSANGQVIASGGDDKITLYRTRDGHLLSRFADPDNDLTQPQRVPAASGLQSSGLQSSGLQSSGLQQLQRHRVRALAFSPDGQWLASGGDDCIVRLWSVEKLLNAVDVDYQPLRLTGHSATVQTLCFNADSKLLVSGGSDKTLRVWDVESGKKKKSFMGLGDRVRSVAISPDGLLVSGGDDCQISLWDLNQFKHLKDIPTGQSRIWSVDFQQQANKLLLSAGGDKQALMLWQVNAEKTSSAIQAQTQDPTQAQTQDPTQDPTQAQTSVEQGFSRVVVRPVRTYRGYTSGIRAVAFVSEDRVIGGGDSGELSVWDLAGDRKATLPLHEGRIWSIAVDLQNARIASASDDYTIRLWNAKTGQCLTTLIGHNNWVRAVDFSRHGRFLVSSGDDCNIRIWNTASGFCRRILAHSDYWIRSVKFDPTNNRYLVSGGDDQVVRHWDSKEAFSRPLVQHEHRICSVAYSPDGKMVASGSDDATVILCDVQNAQVIYRFANADLGIKSVAFSPDGQYLAAGGEDQLVYVWDLRSPQPEESCVVLRPSDYSGLAGGIRAVAFSPSGRYVISGGLDQMIRIGDLRSIKEASEQVLTPLIARDRPYESIVIENVTGLSRLQLANLITLGAVSRKTCLLT